MFRGLELAVCVGAGRLTQAGRYHGQEWESRGNLPALIRTTPKTTEHLFQETGPTAAIRPKSAATARRE